MKHLDELTATLRMTLMFMLALLGIAWGSAKLFALMGVPPAGSWLFAIFLVAIIGLVLSDKWRKLQKEDAQKSAEPPSTEEPGSVIVDQLETGQLVLARDSDKKAARSFRVPKSAFVSVLDGMPTSRDDDYLIQLVSGRTLCVRRGVSYWKQEGASGDTVFDSDRQVVRYARIDTTEPVGAPKAPERPPEQAETPDETIKFWAERIGGCLVTLASGKSEWVVTEMGLSGKTRKLWRRIQGWGPEHGEFKEMLDGAPDDEAMCLVETDAGTRAVCRRHNGYAWYCPDGQSAYFDPDVGSPGIVDRDDEIVVRYAPIEGPHVTKRRMAST